MAHNFTTVSTMAEAKRGGFLHEVFYWSGSTSGNRADNASVPWLANSMRNSSVSVAQLGNQSVLWGQEGWANGSAPWEMDQEWQSAPVQRGPICTGLEWQVYMEMILVPVLTVLGLLGNTLSFLVLFSPIYSRRSYSYYLRALAVFDSLTLVITTVLTFNNIVFELSDRTIRYLGGHTTLTCKLAEYIRHVIYVMSSWLVVCFTVDRYIAVCHPLQRARLCTEGGALTTLALVFFGACTSQTYILVFVQKVERSGAMLCHADKEQRLIYMGIYYFLFSFTLRFALPFLIIVIFNGLIMFHIRRMRAGRMSREREKKRTANLAIYTLFVVCVVFVITLLPNAIIAMLQFIYYMIYQSLALYCPLKALNSPFQMVRLINYSANFILYGMTGRQFRREVRKLLCCRLHIREFSDRMRDMALMPAHKNTPIGTPATPGQHDRQHITHNVNLVAKCRM